MNLDLTQLVAIAAALGWASGLRLYAVVFLTGLAGWLGWVHVPGDLHPLLDRPEDAQLVGLRGPVDHVRVGLRDGLHGEGDDHEVLQPERVQSVRRRGQAARACRAHGQRFISVRAAR